MNVNVETRRTCAYWYAVGHADATGEPDRASEFSTFASDQATAYYVNQSATSLPSVPDQWEDFCGIEPNP